MWCTKPRLPLIIKYIEPTPLSAICTRDVKQKEGKSWAEAKNHHHPLHIKNPNQ